MVGVGSEVTDSTEGKLRGRGQPPQRQMWLEEICVASKTAGRGRQCLCLEKTSLGMERKHVW